MGIIKTLIVIALVYYAAKFIIKVFAPLLFSKLLRYMANNVAKQQSHQHSQNTKVGETTIDAKPPTDKNMNKNVGEYIDFEEIKE
jgi:hypothetical protein